LFAHRRQREAAVAGDDAGDAVERGRVADRVPGDLRVVVRVRVDDARRHHSSVGVELAPGPATREAADRRDRAAGDADVGVPRRHPRTVDDEPVANDEVEHGATSLCLPTRYPPLPPPARRTWRSTRATRWSACR